MPATDMGRTVHGPMGTGIISTPGGDYPGCQNANPVCGFFGTSEGILPVSRPLLPISGFGTGTRFRVPWHLGTRYRINAEGRTPKAEPGHWTPVGEGRYDSAWDPGTTWTGSRDSYTTPCVAACPESPGRSTTSASGARGSAINSSRFRFCTPPGTGDSPRACRWKAPSSGGSRPGPPGGWVPRQSLSNGSRSNRPRRGQIR
jgi:hypothetical protein